MRKDVPRFRNHCFFWMVRWRSGKSGLYGQALMVAGYPWNLDVLPPAPWADGAADGCHVDGRLRKNSFAVDKPWFYVNL